MKRIGLLILLLIFTTASRAQNRIMLVGDSVTRGLGSTDETGFRQALYDSLLSVSYPFEFVGSAGTTPLLGHFRSGIEISDLYDEFGGTGDFDIDPEMDLWKPNVLLIHIGTNDMSTYTGIGPYTYDGGETFASNRVTGHLAYLLAKLLKWKDGERGDCVRRIYVSKIIPKLAYMGRVEEFNAIIDSIHAHSESGRIPLIPPGSFRIVDHFSTFDVETMMRLDGVHPNDTGYEHMAGIYFHAMKRMPFSLVRVSPDPAYGVAGQLLSDTLKVRALDAYGDGVPDVDVRFEVTSGEASLLEDQPVSTNPLGIAVGRVQLGMPGTSFASVISEGLIDSLITFEIIAAEGLLASGHVTYYQGDVPVPDVTVKWSEGEGVVDTTDGEGRFMLAPLPYHGKITIQPSKVRDDDGVRDAILSYDAALVARASMGLENLSAMQSLAADADGNGSISLFDAAQIARYAVGLSSEITGRVAEWVFKPDSVIHPDLVSNLYDQDFEAILLGDLHGGWSDLDLMEKPKASAPGVRIESPKTEDSWVIFPVVLDRSGILGIDMTIRIDAKDLVPIDAVSATGDQDTHLLCREMGRNQFRLGMYGIDAFPQGTIIMIRCCAVDAWTEASVTLEDVVLNDVQVEDQRFVFSAENHAAIPAILTLYSNYPNPFNSGTVFRYRLPEKSNLTLTVYNAMGQRVAILWNGEQIPGEHEMVWDGRDDRGRHCSSGSYILLLETERANRSIRMEILR